MRVQQLFLGFVALLLSEQERLFGIAHGAGRVAARRTPRAVEESRR
jgi:hypothetical protein